MRLPLLFLLAAGTLNAVVQAKVGSFTQGTTVVASVGFTPQAVLFFCTTATADGSTADLQVGFGAAQSSSARYAFWSSSLDASGTGVANRALTAVGTILINNTAGTTLGLADLVSLDSAGGGGFTLSWTTDDTVDRIINYIAMGGFTDVAVGSFTTATATGDADMTSLGFQPDVVITQFMANANGINNLLTTSWFTGTQQFAYSGQAINSSLSAAKRYQRNDKAHVDLVAATGALFSEATVVSMLSNGFRWNYTTVGASGLTMRFLALKGGSIAIGTTTQPTSDGTATVSGLGFTPALIMLMGDGAATSTSIGASFRWSIGAASSTSAMFTQSAGRTDNEVVTIASTNLDRTKAIEFITEAGASPTVNSAAAVSVIGSDGFTLNWTPTDATAREVGYLAIGNAGVVTSQPRRRTFIQ